MHGFEHYGIIAIEAANAVDYSQVGETSIDTIRMNLAPTFIEDGTIVPLQVLTHEEALALMATPEWSEPIPVE
jgi:hypothetical protein